MRNIVLTIFILSGFIMPVKADENHRGERDNQRQQNQGDHHDERGRQDGNRGQNIYQRNDQQRGIQQQHNVDQPRYQQSRQAPVYEHGKEHEPGQPFESWRHDDRYNWQAYRQYHPDFYRLPQYYAPHGYGYRRFSIGVFIPAIFFSQSYWVRDPWYYRLPRPYPDTRWIRYYHDVLLIDVRTGAVIDVVYDFFW